MENTEQWVGIQYFLNKMPYMSEYSMRFNSKFFIFHIKLAKCIVTQQTLFTLTRSGTKDPCSSNRALSMRQNFTKMWLSNTSDWIFSLPLASVFYFCYYCWWADLLKRTSHFSGRVGRANAATLYFSSKGLFSEIPNNDTRTLDTNLQDCCLHCPDRFSNSFA